MSIITVFKSTNTEYTVRKQSLQSFICHVETDLKQNVERLVSIEDFQFPSHLLASESYVLEGFIFTTLFLILHFCLSQRESCLWQVISLVSFFQARVLYTQQDTAEK